MGTRFYDTDLTDAAWPALPEVLPAARPGGRLRTTKLRAVLNAIFYLPRSGCQWRLLPREFPPCRQQTARAVCPSVVIMDGQSIKTNFRG